MGTDEYVSIAMRYTEAGLSVIPVRADGSKAPALKEWTPYQHHLPGEDELRQWFVNGVKRGIAVVCGAVSGNFAVLDFDSDAAFAVFHDIVVEHDPQELVERLPCAKTPNGFHLYLRTPEPLRTEVLARDENGGVLVEIRGAGSYAIVPPSPAEVHPDQKPYKMVAGDLCAVPQLTTEEVEDLLTIARALNRKVEPTTQPLRVTGDAKRGGDRYNKEADVLPLLERRGWRISSQGRNGNIYLTRPGKSRGVSATWNPDLRLLYVFTTNAHPFEAGKAYSPFAVYALLEHNGDFSAAAKALAGENTAPPVAVPHGGGVTEWLQRHGVTFAELAQMDFPPVEWAVESVIPAAGLTMLVGKKGIGKSWALLELAVNLANGRPVWGLSVPKARKTAYIALEDTPRRLEDRRRGAFLEASSNALLFTQWLPAEQGGREALRALVHELGVKVVIIDTLSAWRMLLPQTNGRNVWQEEHALVRDLQQFAMEEGICLVLAHHRNKLASEDVDSIAGTGGLSAPVDTVIIATRSRGEAEGVFRVFGRDVPEQELAMGYTGTRWTVIGDAREYAISEERRRILEAVRELGEASPREVKEVTGLPHGSVRHLLARMCADGTLKKTARGKYAPATTEQMNEQRSQHSQIHNQIVNDVNDVNSANVVNDVNDATITQSDSQEVFQKPANSVPTGSTCVSEPGTTPLGTAIRAIEAALAGGKRMSRLELYQATGLPPTVFEEALQHMLTTGELFAEAGAYGLQEVEDDRWDT
jgi:DNA-binding transcriptional ArsR family regulator